MIKEINWFEYRDRINTYYGATRVKVRLDELETIMRAAKKTIKFYLDHDSYLGGGLTVEAKEMAEAYKNMSRQLEAIQMAARSKAEEKVSKEYKIK